MSLLLCFAFMQETFKKKLWSKKYSSNSSNRNVLDFLLQISNTQFVEYNIWEWTITRKPVYLVRAYIAYVRPVLEYATQVWSPHHVSLINLLETVQRGFTKRIPGFWNLSYAVNMLVTYLLASCLILALSDIWFGWTSRNPDTEIQGCGKAFLRIWICFGVWENDQNNHESYRLW